jgi:peptidoglycan/xylan/chitin deacetylase (PgdA/CDA1 family)
MSDPPRLTCCLTFDFDALSLWIGTFHSTNPSMLSRGEFGAVAIPRILKILAQREIRATFFIPGHTALAYPETVRAIAAAGHEIGHHGWVHESPADFDAAGERANLERAFDALDAVTGVRPRGYRSPAAVLTEATLGLLLEYGFLYDSSCMATDFYPYYLRLNDRWSTTEPYVFGETSSLVEASFSWSLSDFSRFEFVWAQNPGFSSPSQVEEIWKGEFEYAYRECPGGLYNLTLHPQVIGRGHRLIMFESLLDHFGSLAGVGFEPLAEYVDRWKNDNPVEAWATANPTLAGAGRHEQLPPQ